MKESNKSITNKKLVCTFNKLNNIKSNDSNNNIGNKNSNGGSKISKNNENKIQAEQKEKISEKSNETKSKNSANSSYLNSTPGGEDSKELSDYYENEKKVKLKEEAKIKEKIKESQKKIDEEQNDITKSFSFKDFKKPSKVTLDNDENTTYMNCVIQCLSNFKFMICYYLNNLNEIKNKLYKMPLSYALSRIIFHLNPYPQNNLQKSFSIANFHKAVSYKNPFFSGNSEKDPIDFIVFLLEFLHEEDGNEMGQKKNNNDTTPSMDNSKLYNYLNYLRENEHSIIFDNFCWINRTLKICTKCNSKFFTYQKYFTFDLKLDFENKNIDNSINNNFNINNFISNNGNSVKNILQEQMKEKVNISAYCQGCKKKVEFIKNSSIIFFPNVFIILMKKNDKNTQLLIDEEMELSNEEEKIKYKLNGVIAYNKLKNSFNYKAYCLNSIDNNWYKYDDTVEKIDKDNFLFNNNNSEYILPPTILFYKKI